MKLKKYIVLLVVCLTLVMSAFPVFAVHGPPDNPPQPAPQPQISNPARWYLVDFNRIGGENTFAYLFTFFIQKLLQVAGVLAILFVIIGGFQYISSGANEEWAEAGKKTLTNAIIGLAIIILSYVLVAIINNALG